ncbi:MAG TPA: ABC transporter substrate-binding protein [Acidimicrobiales bacterium]|nr:ABC transporter substrate-binding protein [Acidimicrobiales bacterium]
MNRSTHRWWWRLLALLAALSLVAAACGDDDADDAADTGTDDTADTDTGDDPGTTDDTVTDDAGDGGPTPGGTVVVGLEAESNSWLPGTASWATSGYSVAHSIFDPLVAFDADGQIQPYLAESVTPNDDLTEWTLTLRDGVTFHDGSALTAEVVKWNIDTLHNVATSNTQGALLNAGFTEIRVDDELTVTYVLSGPNAAFPDLLRNVIGMPASQQAYEELGAEGFAAAPVGTGPFVFDTWERDSRLIVTKNPDYWRTDADGNQLPYLDSIEWRPIPDEDSRVQSLASGDVTVMQTLRGTAVKQVQALIDDGGYDGSFFVGNEAGVSIFNVLIPPLDDLRIRQAAGYAGDSEAVAAVLGDDGLVPVTTQFFSVDSPWYSEAVAEAYPGYPERDIDTAIALVDEYKADPNRSDGKAVGDPVTVQYNCPPDPSLIEVAQLIQALWGEAGIEVTLNQVEQAAHIANAVGSPDTDPPFAGDYVVNCWRAGGLDDPSIIFGNAFGPVETSPLNFTNYTNPRITELVEVLRTEADFDARYAAVEEIGLILSEEMPMTWGVGTPTIVGHLAEVNGVASWTLPDGTPGNGTPSATMRLVQTWIEG